MQRAKISFSPVEKSEHVCESTQITSMDVQQRLVNYRGRLVSHVFLFIIISIEEF